MKNRLRAIAAIACAFVSLWGAAALEAPVAVRPTWGVLIESVADTSAPAFSPGLYFNLGAGVIMPFAPDSVFSFVPSADLYYYTAALNASGRAVPVDNSQGGSGFVLGLLLDAPVVYNLSLGKFALGLGLGLCLDLRVAFGNDINTQYIPAMNAYFWDKARFLMPSITLRGEYQLTERVSFGIKSRMLVPVYNLWAGEGTGFLDHAKYLVDLAILYKLGGGPPAAPAPADSARQPEAPAPALEPTAPAQQP